MKTFLAILAILPVTLMLIVLGIGAIYMFYMIVPWWVVPLAAGILTAFILFDWGMEILNKE